MWFTRRWDYFAWFGGVEWEHSEAMTVDFAPSLKDAVPIWMDDGNLRFGEDNLAA